MLQGKKVLVGVTGGIAAYKAADLVSALRQAGAEVFVLMTENAKKFVSPLTFRSLSHNPVITRVFSKSDQRFPHLALAENADLLIVAPATANFIGKAANGVADDILSTTFLSVKCPVLIAPAMNTAMYENKLVQENIERLKRAGVLFLRPKKGELACGKKGQGKLADVAVLFRAVQKALKLSKKTLPLRGKNIIITGGGSKEAIDPIRYITNASSGKMAKALEQAALKLGAKVNYIDAATSVKDLQKKLFRGLPQADAVIMAAAVSDYRPKHVAKKKLASGREKLVLELERTPDLLAQLGARKKKQKLIGFCLETGQLVQNAKKKLQKKNLDLIIANTPAALGSEENKATLVFKNGKVLSLPKMTKTRLAEKILAEICRSFNK